MEVLFSDTFKKEFRKIKDKTLRLKILKQIKKLETLPESGKPLRHDHKLHRSLRVRPFRIIYRLDGERIIVNCFDHRDHAYK